MGGNLFLPGASVRESLCATAKVLLDRCVLHSAQKDINYTRYKPSKNVLFWLFLTSARYSVCHKNFFQSSAIVL